MKLICQRLSHLHTCMHTHTIINPLKMYGQQLTKWGTCQKLLTAKSWVLQRGLLTNATRPLLWPCCVYYLLWPSHLATPPYFSFVTKGQFTTLPLPSSSETPACSFFSPWFPHKGSQSKMSDQLDCSRISEKDPAWWNLDLFLFLLPWGWVCE